MFCRIHIRVIFFSSYFSHYFDQIHNDTFHKIYLHFVFYFTFLIKSIIIRLGCFHFFKKMLYPIILEEIVVSKANLMDSLKFVAFCSALWLKCLTI